MSGSDGGGGQDAPVRVGVVGVMKWRGGGGGSACKAGAVGRWNADVYDRRDEVSLRRTILAR